MFPSRQIIHEKSLAGKDSTFKCKLNSIKFNEKPELDDEFVRDVSEFDTVTEYTADIKAKLEKAKHVRRTAQLTSSSPQLSSRSSMRTFPP